MVTLVKTIITIFQCIQSFIIIWILGQRSKQSFQSKYHMSHRKHKKEDVTCSSNRFAAPIYGSLEVDSFTLVHLMKIYWIDWNILTTVMNVPKSWSICKSIVFCFQSTWKKFQYSRSTFTYISLHNDNHFDLFFWWGNTEQKC